MSPLSAPVERKHLHTRRYEFQGYQRTDGLWDIEGRMTDTKTYGFPNEWRGEIKADEPIHDMWLRLTLDDDLVVTSRLIEVSAVRVAIHQTVRCGAVKLTDARVTVAWVGPNGRPRRQPADWIAIYQRLVWQGDTQHP